ncbi:DUF3404 domain-containing protein [Photobacterium aphoticum]|uniref:histidine kinase n=1 Tax=Photobacterium aphoticum TaxID=754436 RepID=A0A0J1GL09_9GAMM|nr:DUF3404 domain-containing protein [Photobacterium aphoticum]KLV00388.1 histidine kinase [Photobacterium aphoticum]PSU59914.1 DUF3404 domain-containing protein [Photobacterium aphoticum]GHA42861.1 sensor histidine kinase [Photobacterium aphoticum]
MLRYLLITYLAFFSVTSAHAQLLQDKWQTFYRQSWQIGTLAVSQQQLSQYPLDLLQDAARYPQFSTFDWQDIVDLSAIKAACKDNALRNARLNDAVAFELAMCQKTPLSADWFITHSLIHPAGGSFADRYINQFPDSTLPISHLLTITHPHHPLHKALEALSPQGRDALLHGYRAWKEQDTLWLSGNTGWKRLSRKQWQPLAQSLDITLQGEECAFRYSNLCISEQPQHLIAQRVLLALLCLILTAALCRLLYLKRRQNTEKQFILQLLTHELRTPITSLGLTVEMFRHHYAALPDATQDAVWRLVADYQRLSQLTENSKLFLSADASAPLPKQSASLEDWLQFICEKHNVSYSLNHDAMLSLPFYWLSICLDNLIKNAKQHGQGTISVFVVVDTTLTIHVDDEGQFPSRLSRLFRRMKQPANTPNNMGIGLGIVNHLMKQMGGTLSIQRCPTRCTLELPYDHTITD